MLRRAQVFLAVLTLIVVVGAGLAEWWRATSLLPYSDETRTFARSDVIARYCPFSSEELSRAIGLQVMPQSVTLGPPGRPKMIHCVFTVGDVSQGHLTLAYFLRRNPAETLRHNRQSVAAVGAEVTGDDVAQDYVFNGNATAEYISGDFTVHWHCESTGDADVQRIRRGLAALPRRPPPTASASDVWALGTPISGDQAIAQ